MKIQHIELAGVGCVLALLASGAAAENERMDATVEKPALVTATGPSTPSTKSHVVISVTGFQPAAEGAVQAVVKARNQDGTEQELGRFGLHPQTSFKSEPTGAQRYSVPLPKNLASEGSVNLKVELVPGLKGTGEGARLELGGAEIR